jgi:hypothetical protein
MSTVLTINSDYFHKEHELTYLCSCEELCFFFAVQPVLNII